MGRIAQWIAFSPRTQRPRVRFSAFPTELTYSVDIVETNRQQHCLVLRGQCKKLNNVDRTHLALQDSATKKEKKSCFKIARAVKNTATLQPRVVRFRIITAPFFSAGLWFKGDFSGTQ